MLYYNRSTRVKLKKYVTRVPQLHITTFIATYLLYCTDNETSHWHTKNTIQP